MHMAKCQGYVQGEEAAKWITKFLGVGCRIVLLVDNKLRKVSDKANKWYEKRKGLSYCDDTPFLLLNETSLKNL